MTYIRFDNTESQIICSNEFNLIHLGEHESSFRQPSLILLMKALGTCQKISHFFNVNWLPWHVLDWAHFTTQAPRLRVLLLAKRRCGQVGELYTTTTKRGQCRAKQLPLLCSLPRLTPDRPLVRPTAVERAAVGSLGN